MADDNKGNNDLHKAVLNGDKKWIDNNFRNQMELKKYFVANNDGITPLHMAIQTRNYDIISSLVSRQDQLGVSLDAGYKPKGQDIETSVQELAFNTNDPKVMQTLLGTTNHKGHSYQNRAESELDPKLGNKMLFSAIEDRNFTMAQKLVDLGADLDPKLGNKMLSSAIKNHNFEVAQKLVDFGANVDGVRGQVEEMPIKSMAVKLTEQMSKNALNSNDAEVQAKTESAKDLFKSMIKKGADPFKKDASGKSCHGVMLNIEKNNQKPKLGPGSDLMKESNKTVLALYKKEVPAWKRAVYPIKENIKEKINSFGEKIINRVKNNNKIFPQQKTNTKNNEINQNNGKNNSLEKIGEKLKSYGINKQSQEVPAPKSLDVRQQAQNIGKKIGEAEAQNPAKNSTPKPSRDKQGQTRAM
jgi:ankyrin repeat protein